MFGQRSVNDGGQFLLAERMREVDEFLIHRDSYLTFRHISILRAYWRSVTVPPTADPGSVQARLRGLWLPTAALTGEGPKPRLPRVPAVHDGSVGDEVVQRATITLQHDAQEA